MHRRSTPCLILFVISCVGICCRAQSSPADAISPEAAKPLPDVPTLMRQVEVNQRKAEALEQNYIYDEAGTFTEQDSHGATKKTDSREFEIFWLNDVRVARLVKKDGKPLSADELKKENDRIDNVVKKAKERRDKADAEGKETDSHGHDEITVSRMLELGTFSNPRREMINGFSTWKGTLTAISRWAADCWWTFAKAPGSKPAM
jgi:hypothetical protein